MTLTKCSDGCCTYYETNSLEEATYLICKGYTLVQIISAGFGLFYIRFKYCFYIEADASRFDLGSLDVNKHKFKKVLNTLRFLFSVGYQDGIVNRSSEKQDLNTGEYHDKQ